MNDILSLLGLERPADLGRAAPTVDVFSRPEQQFSMESLMRLMGDKEREVFLDKLLKNLEITGEYSQFANDNVKRDVWGGRAGYNLPLDESSAIRAGISGGGYKVDTPIGQFKDREITGGDIGYKFGPNDLSLSYTSRGVFPGLSDENSPMTINDFWRLLYRRQF